MPFILIPLSTMSRGTMMSADFTGRISGNGRSRDRYYGQLVASAHRRPALHNHDMRRYLWYIQRTDGASSAARFHQAGT